MVSAAEGDTAKDLSVPFHFTALEDNVTVWLEFDGSAATPVKLRYALTEDGTVPEFRDFFLYEYNAEGGEHIAVPKGAKLYFTKEVGADESFSGAANRKIWRTSGGKVSVGGNILSLVYWDSAMYTQGIYPREGKDLFRYMFTGNENLVDASELIIPDSKELNVKNYACCFLYAFKNCTNLVKGPDLPWKTIPVGGYREMFRDCTSLKETPEIAAAKTNTESCYGMFDGCWSLEKVRLHLETNEFLETDRKRNPCNYMFNECYNIKIFITDYFVMRGSIEYWLAPPRKGALFCCLKGSISGVPRNEFGVPAEYRFIGPEPVVLLEKNDGSGSFNSFAPSDKNYFKSLEDNRAFLTKSAFAYAFPEAAEDNFSGWSLTESGEILEWTEYDGIDEEGIVIPVTNGIPTVLYAIYDDASVSAGSVISSGNLWVIVVIALAAVAAVAILAVWKKKKASANGGGKDEA